MSLASYVNRQGDKIEVSDEHLETSIRIKLELQNASPSGKSSWKKHKELMESEGFFDSDTNENYRCLIKAVQKKKDILPSTATYAEFVTDKKIESLNALVGDLYVANRERQNINRVLNKTKREIADESLIIKELKEHIKNLKVVETVPQEPVVRIENENEYVGVVTPADWHIGMTHRGMTLDTAKNRINHYRDKIAEYAHKFNIQVLIVSHLGDIINHAYMHKNTQAYGIEMNVSEQITTATKLLFEFLRDLSNEFIVVYTGTIVGNHGRMSTKGETLTNDAVEVVVHEMVKTMIELAGLPNLKIQDSNYHKDYGYGSVANERLMLFIHGDKDSKGGAERLRKYSSILGSQVDILFQGHVHNYKVESENYDRMVITSGSLMGSDDYAENLGLYTNASQVFTVVGNNQTIPIPIPLSHIN